MQSYFEIFQSPWLLAGVAALCIGLAKAGLGGFGMITVLLMAEVLPARESTGVVLPLLIVGDLFAVATYRHHAQWHYIRRLLVPSLVGIVLGYLLMNVIPGQNFKQVVGWIVLTLAALQLVRRWLDEAWVNRWAQTRRFGTAIGCLGGAATMMANAAGPVMSLYLLVVKLPKYEIIGTGAWFFLILNVIKVPFSAHLGLINGTSMTLVATLAPLVVVGIGLGRVVVGWVPQRVFNWILLLSAIGGALRMLLR